MWESQKYPYSECASVLIKTDVGNVRWIDGAGDCRSTWTTLYAIEEARKHALLLDKLWLRFVRVALTRTLGAATRSLAARRGNAVHLQLGTEQTLVQGVGVLELRNGGRRG